MCWFLDGWLRGEARHHNWDYSKERWIVVVSREQTFPSSKHTSHYPSAHPKVSLPSITPSLHLPPVFILRPVTSVLFTPTCLRLKYGQDSAVSQTHNVSFISDGNPSSAESAGSAQSGSACRGVGWQWVVCVGRWQLAVAL